MKIKQKILVNQKRFENTAQEMRIIRAVFISQIQMLKYRWMYVSAFDASAWRTIASRLSCPDIAATALTANRGRRARR